MFFVMITNRERKRFSTEWLNAGDGGIPNAATPLCGTPDEQCDTGAGCCPECMD
jgi:hypothetical protein